jgi:hypothetical protein
MRVRHPAKALALVVDILALTLEIVEVLQEEQSRGLLGIVELGREPVVVPHHAVHVIESVLKHLCPFVVLDRDYCIAHARAIWREIKLRLSAQ